MMTNGDRWTELDRQAADLERRIAALPEAEREPLVQQLAAVNRQLDAMEGDAAAAWYETRQTEIATVKLRADVQAMQAEIDRRKAKRRK